MPAAALRLILSLFLNPDKKQASDTNLLPLAWSMWRSSIALQNQFLVGTSESFL
jgi:hypothetical protein